MPNSLINAIITVHWMLKVSIFSNIHRVHFTYLRKEFLRMWSRFFWLFVSKTCYELLPRVS